MNILLLFPGFILALIIVLYYERKIRRTRNKVHFYVARDKDGMLYLYMGKPFRDDTMFDVDIIKGSVVLTSNRLDFFKYFGLNKKDYANLKWEDEPVEVFINMEY